MYSYPMSTEPIAPTGDSQAPPKFFSKLRNVRHITSLSPLNEHVMHCTIAYPILDAIMEAVDEGLGADGTDCSYDMGELCPTACKSRKPVVMLYGEGCHFACVAVRRKVNELGAALDDAISASMLLTAKTGYSVIIVGVGGDFVEMGLMSLLDMDWEDECDNTRTAGLTVFPADLKQRLHTANVGIEGSTRSGWADIHSSGSILTYCIYFKVSNVMGDFDCAFREYLSLLTKPICSGLLKGIPCKHELLDGCQFVTNTNIPVELQLADMPESTGGSECVYKVFTVKAYDRAMSIARAEKSPFCALLAFQRGPDPPASDDDEKRKSEAFWAAIFSDLDGPSVQVKNTETKTTKKKRAPKKAPSEDKKDKSPDENDSLTICCVYRHPAGVALTGKPSAIVAAKLLAIIVVLHDVHRMAHCDIRRCNVLVSGTDVELTGYEHRSCWLGDAVLPPASTPCMIALRKVFSLLKNDRRRKYLLSINPRLRARMIDVITALDLICTDAVESELISRDFPVPDDNDTIVRDFFLSIDSDTIHPMGAVEREGPTSDVATGGGEDCLTRDAWQGAIVKMMEDPQFDEHTSTKDILSRVFDTGIVDGVKSIIERNSLFKKRTFVDVNGAIT